MREACKPPEARNPRVEFEWARLAAHDTDPCAEATPLGILWHCANSILAMGSFCCRRISDEGMRILEGDRFASVGNCFGQPAHACWYFMASRTDLLKRQLDEFEEGCLYFLATAHRHRGVRPPQLRLTIVLCVAHLTRDGRSSRSHVNT